MQKWESQSDTGTRGTTDTAEQRHRLEKLETENQQLKTLLTKGMKFVLAMVYFCNILWFRFSVTLMKFAFYV